MLGRIKLTAKDILEKDFKVAMRGYRQEEVDKFLDIIIQDYEMFGQIIEQLQRENAKLKQHGKGTETKQVAQPLSGTTNFDILQRLSNLEKHVFGSKLFD